MDACFAIESNENRINIGIEIEDFHLFVTDREKFDPGFNLDPDLVIYHKLHVTRIRYKTNVSG